MRGLLRTIFPSAILIILASSSALLAQATTCPPKTLLSIARAGAACVNLEAGTACYGSGLVSSTVPEGSDSPGLVQLGDRVPLRDLGSVSVAPTGTEELSMAALAVRTSPRATDVLTMLLIGDANVESQVVPPVEQIMQAAGSLNLRAAPAEDAPILATLGINNRVVANGRYGNWVRVVNPANAATGWVASSLLSGDVSRLESVEPGDMVAQPFGVFFLSVGVGTACGESLRDGALMQTPSTDLKDAVTVTINGMTLRLWGTAFYARVNDAWFLIILDGAAQAGDQIVPAGAMIMFNAIGAPVTPYDELLIAALPINNLPRRFTVTPPLTQAAIDARIAELTTLPPTPIPVEPTPVNVCRRSVGRQATVWSGPGEDYESLRRLDAGTAIRPVLATTDTLGATWWQLSDSGWVKRSDVVERGDCPDVPVVARVQAPPTNTYSLERCASNNGPVRAGQTVTFEFVPPAWDNLGEATAAIRSDPGRFTINAQTYRARASAPFRLGEVTDPLEDRYLRRFTLSWRAEPGTFRVTGDWLSYEPSCNLTVAVE